MVLSHQDGVRLPVGLQIHVLYDTWYNVCMDTYKFAVVLEVAVEAFDEDDARTVIGDYLNPGPLDDMISITKTTIKHK